MMREPSQKEADVPLPFLVFLVRYGNRTPCAILRRLGPRHFFAAVRNGLRGLWAAVNLPARREGSMPWPSWI